MQDLRVSIVQFSQVWENIDANLDKIEKMLEGVETDLIVLPEMFSTGFTMNPSDLAEPMYGPTTHWMLKIAEEKHCAITGSIIVKIKDQYHNRLLWVNPFGAVQYYDKAHLFRMGKENDVYTAGEKRNLMVCKSWSVCPLICYDLRFPIWSRNFVFPESFEYDLLIYVASWPDARIDHWQKLLPARAIENLSYVVGVNRIGEDGNGMLHTGSSAIIDYKGNIMDTAHQSENVITTTLSKSQLVEYREQFPAALDAQPFCFPEKTV